VLLHFNVIKLVKFTRQAKTGEPIYISLLCGKQNFDFGFLL